MSILITGSSGYIGSRFIKKLEEHFPRDEIKLISRRNQKGFQTYNCDFLYDSIPNEAFKSVNTVYHLAGCAHDINNKKTEEDYLKINVDATIKMAELSIKNNVKNFIFLSSIKAEENSDIYGKSKRKAEIELLSILGESDINHTILRSSLVYGSQLKGNLLSMLNGIKAGWFPPIPDNNNKRSMIHHDDLISALLFVTNNTEANSKILTVTDGNAYSSRQIYNVLCRVADKRPPKWEVPILFFRLFSLLGSNAKFKVNKIFGDDLHSSKEIELLGFKAKKTIQDI